METSPQTAVRMEQKMHTRKKRKGRMPLLVSAGSIMLFGVIGVLMAWMSGDATDDLAEKWADYGIVLDENCESGPLEQNMDDDTPMEYGSLRYQLNAAPWFADCDAKGTVCFQNNRGNRHFVRISYQLDSGEKVYQSEMIPPDSHIHRAGLDQQLSRGEYGGVCRIELFDMDSLEPIGILEENITITVQR